MITIVYACANPECAREVQVSVLAQPFYRGQHFRAYQPRGWRIRTPRGTGAPARAFCPEHAEDLPTKEFRSGGPGGEP